MPHNKKCPNKIFGWSKQARQTLAWTSQDEGQNNK